MAGTALKDVLKRVAKELEDEELRDELNELRSGRQAPTLADLLELIKNATPEEKAQLREAFVEAEVDPAIVDDAGKPPKGKRKPAAPPPEDDDDGGNGEPPPQRRTRPGRRNGAAYDWAVDEETGEIVRAPMAYIYTGEDEPDEVEMMPAATRASEEEGDEGAEGEE